MKRKLLLLNIFCICIGCSHPHSPVNHVSTTDISKIGISYVEMEIERVYGITCDNFEQFFQDEIKTTTITNSLLIEHIVTVLNALPNGPDWSKPDVDTRMKIKLYSNDTLQEIICIDRNLVLKENKLYLWSDELRKILDIITKEGG
jgi:hypothetical protein